MNIDELAVIRITVVDFRHPGAESKNVDWIGYSPISGRCDGAASYTDDIDGNLITGR